MPQTSLLVLPQQFSSRTQGIANDSRPPLSCKHSVPPSLSPSLFLAPSPSLPPYLPSSHPPSHLLSVSLPLALPPTLPTLSLSLSPSLFCAPSLLFVRSVSLPRQGLHEGSASAGPSPGDGISAAARKQAVPTMFRASVLDLLVLSRDPYKPSLVGSFKGITVFIPAFPTEHQQVDTRLHRSILIYGQNSNILCATNDCILVCPALHVSPVPLRQVLGEHLVLANRSSSKRIFSGPKGFGLGLPAVGVFAWPT